MKTTEQFIIEANKIHGHKYDYSKVTYTGALKKVCIICPEHGEFWQTPNKHLSGQGCVLCHRPVHDTESFIQRAKKIYGDVYDYSKIEYINEKTPVVVVCKKHGPFKVIPNNFLMGRCCPKCKREKWEKEHSEKFLSDFIKRANKIHNGKYDYSKVVYKSAKTKVCIICPEHGEFWQTPDSHLKGAGCPICKDSRMEKHMKSLLNEKNIDYIPQYCPDFLRDKAKKSYQKCDFFIPDKNLVIECQGEQHFKPFKNFDGNDGLKRRIELDIKKNQLLKEHGIKVIYVIAKNISIKKIVDSITYKMIYDDTNCFKENNKQFLDNIEFNG